MGNFARFAKKHKADGLRVEDLDKVLKSQLDLNSKVWLFLVGAVLGGLITGVLSSGSPSSIPQDIKLAFALGIFSGSLLGLFIVVGFVMVTRVLLLFQLRLMNDYLQARKELSQDDPSTR